MKLIEVTAPIERPVLGILLDPAAVERLPAEPFASPLTLQMDAAVKGGVTAYYFTLQDVDPAEMRIHGWVLEDGQWRQRPCPWPDVLYDLVRRVATARDYNFLLGLYETAVPINSARALGKWSTYSILEKCPEVRSMLPASILYQQPSDLMTMLEKHHSVFVKPEWGSGGRGIMRIWADDAGGWGYQESEGEARHGLSFPAIASMVKADKLSGPRLVQQEIPLYEVEGRRCDIRTTMRRNRQGQWQFDSGGIRLAQPGVIVTNWVRGGDWIPFPEGLAVYSAAVSEPETLLARVEEASLMVASCLEASVGRMGELGLDWAFDQDLRLWFLEANPMPTKTIHLPVNGIPHPKYRSVVEYAIYLYERLQQYRQGAGGEGDERA